MANSITTRKEYLTLLDSAFKQSSKTSILEVAPDQVREAETAGTFYIEKMTLVGLGDYSKTTGYPLGDVTLEYVPYTYSYDRGRKFQVDKVDDLETAFSAFGKLSGEFVKQHEVPEVDAVRIAELVSNAGTSVSAELTSASDVVSALNTAGNTLDSAEVPDDDWVLFIQPHYLRMVKTQASTAATTDVIDRATVITVPKGRMYNVITLDDGSSSSSGGYSPANGAVSVNFVLCSRSAVFADVKHQSLKVISPDDNQTSDAWLFMYRVYHDLFVYDNKADGVYAHLDTDIYALS